MSGKRGFTTPFVVMVDDVHPETGYGARMNAGQFKFLEEMAKHELKITLFLTPAWIDRDPAPYARVMNLLLRRDTPHLSNETFRVDRFPEWCRWLATKQNFGMYEIGLHGLYHHAERWHHSMEFVDLPYEECVRRINVAEEILNNTGIPYVKGFSVPGWGYTHELGKALGHLGYRYVTGAQKTLRVLNVYRPNLINGRLLHVPVNWDPEKPSMERVLEIARGGGVVSSKIHIQHISSNTVSEILSAYTRIKKDYDVQPETCSEVEEHYRKILGPFT